MDARLPDASQVSSLSASKTDSWPNTQVNKLLTWRREFTRPDQLHCEDASPS